jgi:hypothetical protein
LNVAALLRRHAALQDEVAAAMSAGVSVGGCVAVIERALAGNTEDILSSEEAAAGGAAAFISSGTSSGGTSAQGSQQEA